MNRILAPLALVLVVVSTNAAPLTIGQPPPPLQLRSVIKGPDIGNISLEKLKGNVVVLEFWATWCGPCVAAFPHINELAAAFEKKPVTFISICMDDVADAMDKITTLLKERKLDTWIVRDGEGNPTAEAYNVHGIPTTILIDRNGNVDAITYPSRVTPAVLQNLVHRKPSGIKAVYETRDTSGDSAGPPLFSLSLSESREHEGNSSHASDKGFGVKGYTTSLLIAWLYDIEPKRVFVDDSLPVKYWNCEATFPETADAATVKEFLKKTVPSTIGVALTENVARSLPNYVLRCPGGVKSGEHSFLKPVASSGGGFMRMSSNGGIGSGSIRATRCTIDDILKSLEGLVDNIIIEETGLKGLYDMTLNFDDPSGSSITAALKECGLELVQEKKTFYGVQVSALQPPAADKSK